MALFLEAAGERNRLETRDYVLLISGTMNPPHRGHVLIGLHAAEALRGKGHTVRALCWTPVHDNYLCNKVSTKVSNDSLGKATTADTICFPMSERCAMLRNLLDHEARSKEFRSICHVLDYEHQYGDDLLEESPGYWAPKLPDGYLKTVPTSGLIQHFAANPEHCCRGARLCIVFGCDNLAGMATWNNPENLSRSADMIFVGRGTSCVTFSRDPIALLSGFRNFEVGVSVAVKYEDKTLFGDSEGSFINTQSTGNGALFFLPALDGICEQLSSTKIRTSIAVCLNTLADHGLADSAREILGNIHEAPTKVDDIRKIGDANGQVVIPCKRSLESLDSSTAAKAQRR